MALSAWVGGASLGSIFPLRCRHELWCLMRHPEDSGLKLYLRAVNSDFRDNLGPGNLHNTLQIYKAGLVCGFFREATNPLPSLVWVIVWVSLNVFCSQVSIRKAMDMFHVKE